MNTAFTTLFYIKSLLFVACLVVGVLLGNTLNIGHEDTYRATIVSWICTDVSAFVGMVLVLILV